MATQDQWTNTPNLEWQNIPAQEWNNTEVLLELFKIVATFVAKSKAYYFVTRTKARHFIAKTRI